MKIPQNTKAADDEISIADMISFFKSNKKLILICVILGAILGSLFGNFTGPIYKGYAIISPAKIGGDFSKNPTATVNELKLNSYYSKKTLLNCNGSNNVNDISISKIIKTSLTKDSGHIEIQMQNKNQTIIEDCIGGIVNDVIEKQNESIKHWVDYKNNALRSLEQKLKISTQFKINFNNEMIKYISQKKEGEENLSVYGSLLLLTENDIQDTIFSINNLQAELSSKNTAVAKLTLPISIEKKWPPSHTYGWLFGLFLGLCVGTLLALLKKIKI